MKLYIMRHAQAEAGAQMNPTRRLTAIGKDQAHLMGRWFKRQSEKPEIVIQSSFKRSQQTAKRVAEELDCPIITSPGIDPDGNPESAWITIKTIGAEQKAEYVLAVSHGPLVELLLAHLTGSPLARQFHFAHAAIAHFATTSGNRGIMHWMVTPNVVARDEDELDLVTSDLHGVIEASLRVAEEALLID